MNNGALGNMNNEAGGNVDEGNGMEIMQTVNYCTRKRISERPCDVLVNTFIPRELVQNHLERE